MTETTRNTIQSHYRSLLDRGVEVDGRLKIADFEPFRRHILVEPLPPDQITGKLRQIILPETAQQPKAMGFVLRINADDAGGPFDVGDLVFFAESAGSELTLEDRPLKVLQYHSIEEGEILGKWPRTLFSESGLDRRAPHLVTSDE